MGKRKRSDRDNTEMESFLKKIKKLVKRRRRISSSSSEDTPELTPAQSPNFGLASDLENQDEIQALEAPLTSEEVIEENPELDTDILELLGSDPTQDKSFGENLHKDLATRWKHILLNGLPKDQKCDLLKQYLPAENCTYMAAPKLNAEVKTALSEINVKKDCYSEQKQNQMSSCISAIGKALNLALTHTDTIPQDIIKTLSDAGRLICDTHYRESLSRRFAIINALSKPKREIIKISKIDEYLFGSNLSEYLKSSKAISASAAELRFSFNKGKFNQTQQRTQPNAPMTRQQGALNARGTPWAQDVEPRVYPSQPRRPPPAPPRDHRRAQPPLPPPRPRNNYQQHRRR